MKNEELTIFVDGACSGNPGPAAIGVVINQGEKRVKAISRSIGEATNNIAEYSALICALQEALILKVSEIKIFTDSELVFKQVTGKYKVKNSNMKNLYDQVQQLLKGFQKVDLQHVLRDKNKEADRLASSAIKK